MALFRLRKTEKSKARKGDAAAPRQAVGTEESLSELRQRARHRLIGAVVLVLAAIIVFPLLFDTEQRPAVVDAPVVIADAGERAAASSSSAEATAGRQADTASPEADAQAALDDDGQGADAQAESDAADPEDAAAPTVDATPIDDEADDLGAPIDDTAEDEDGEEDEFDEGFPTAPAKVRVASRPPAEASRTASAREARPEEPRNDSAAAADRSKPGTTAGKGDEERRAMAALQGQSASSSGGSQQGQFVVQVGAFAQEQQVQSVRQRISGAGLSSFTQVVQTDAGPRTRVRVGPYGSRDEADRARAALERAGLPGQVMGR